MFKKYQGKLYCFSPPVMLATFLIEFTLAFYTLWRYKMDTTGRLAVIILFALGSFQLAEYMLCGGLGLSNVEWARVGYGSITMLPALGIHMIVSIAGKKMPALIGMAYASCAMFLGFYLLAGNSVSLHECQANYAVFNSYRTVSLPFGVYYYGLMLTGASLAWIWGNELPERRNALWSMTIGYLVFILPTATINLIDPATTRGIPSIMCGFAVLFAIILAAKVLPNSCEIRATIQSFREALRFKI